MFYVLCSASRAQSRHVENKKQWGEFSCTVTLHCLIISSLPCSIRHWLAFTGECAKACGKTAFRQLSAAAGLFRLPGSERSLSTAWVCGRCSRAGCPQCIHSSSATSSTSATEPRNRKWVFIYGIFNTEMA